MRRNPIAVLSAATAVAALSACGCSRDEPRPAAEPLTSTSAPSASPVEPGPLPPPETLNDMMSRLTDPAVPGAEKLGLVEDTAAPDAAALDRFATALRDTGFTPVTVSASEIRWSEDHPGDVLATIKLSGPDSGSDGSASGEFSFPMEFRRSGAGWQLTRDTAEELLAFGNGPTPPS